jgi:hypothetical protein
MSTVEELKAAVRELREIRRVPTRGRAVYELNLWKGEQRKALDEEYDRRLAEIEAAPEPTIEDEVSPEVLALVAQAVREGVSRSNIRVALGKQSLAETDEVIALAVDTTQAQVQTGEAQPFTIAPTGETHGRGWPMYEVTLLDTGETFRSVYLITSPNTHEVDRRHLRINPSPIGSSEILDRIHESGAGRAIFDLGKSE